jgi:predicted Zn-dependent peptidase
MAMREPNASCFSAFRVVSRLLFFDHLFLTFCFSLGQGVRVVSLNRQAPYVSLGVALEAGSRFESHENAGAAFTLAQLYMKATRTRSALRVTRDLEAVSTDASATATRDFVLYRATAQRDVASAAVTQLVDLAAPALHHWEVDEAREYIALKADAALTDAARADDLLYGAAFRSQGFGRPVVPHRSAADLSLDALRAYVEQHFTAQRLIIVASGLDVAEAVAIAKNATAYVPTKGTVAPPATPYVGGERYLELPGALTHFSIAHSAAGITRAQAAVLVAALGRHHVENAWRTVGLGGRLAKMQTGSLVSAESFFTGTGPSALLGCRIVSNTSKPAAKLAQARALLESLAQPLDSQALQGAKNHAIRDVLTVHGSRRVVSYLARVASRGGNLSASAFISEINALSAADVAAAAKKVLSTPVSQAAVGNVTGL